MEIKEIMIIIISGIIFSFSFPKKNEVYYNYECVHLKHKSERNDNLKCQLHFRNEEDDNKIKSEHRRYVLNYFAKKIESNIIERFIDFFEI